MGGGRSQEGKFQLEASWFSGSGAHVDRRRRGGGGRVVDGHHAQGALGAAELMGGRRAAVDRHLPVPQSCLSKHTTWRKPGPRRGHEENREITTGALRLCQKAAEEILQTSHLEEARQEVVARWQDVYEVSDLGRPDLLVLGRDEHCGDTHQLKVAARDL
eukprot:361556-Chlamydomonas_euryale.AAC.6